MQMPPVKVIVAVQDPSGRVRCISGYAKSVTNESWNDGWNGLYPGRRREMRTEIEWELAAESVCVVDFGDIPDPPSPTRELGEHNSSTPRTLVP